MIAEMKLKNPQFSLNGCKNIWILKPNYLSRGRGIKCFSKINDILDLVIGKDIQYVAQKYI
jgi:tubulin monoglycylase TTLL3/8